MSHGYAVKKNLTLFNQKKGNIKLTKLSLIELWTRSIKTRVYCKHKHKRFVFFAFAQSTQSKRSYVFYTPLFLSLKKILRFRSTRVANRAVKRPPWGDNSSRVKTLSIILSFSTSETNVSAKVTVVRDQSFRSFVSNMPVLGQHARYHIYPHI